MFSVFIETVIIMLTFLLSLLLDYELFRIPGLQGEIHPVHPKGDQSWVFIGRTDVEAETPILWPPDVKS